MTSRLVILSVNIEISDQMGTSRNQVIGVFDDEAALNSARKDYARQCRESRISFREDRVTLNVPKRIS